MIKKTLLLFILSVGSLWAVQEMRETISSIQDNSVVLKWSFPQKVISQFYYGQSLVDCNNPILGFEADKTIEIRINGLNPGTLYYFKADFNTTNNVRTYFRAGYFRTTGRAASRIERVGILSGRFDADMKILTINPISGSGVLTCNGITPRAFDIVNDGKTNVEKDLGALESCFKYKLRMDGLKSLTTYDITLTMKDDRGQILNLRTNFQTLENDLALNKPVTGTFNSTYIADKVRLTGDVLARVTDGSMDYLHGMAVSGDPELADQWVIVDLQKEYPVTKVTAYWRAMAYPMVYEISISKDGKNWKTSKTVHASQDNVTVANMPMKVDFADFHGENARFIRLFLPQKTPCYKRYDSYKFVELMELKVFGKE